MGLECLSRGLPPHTLPLLSSSIQLRNLDPVNVAAVLGDWAWDLVQLEEGHLRGRSALLRLGLLLAGTACFHGAALQRIRCPPRAWTLVARDTESSQIFVAGELLRPTDCIVLDAGTEIELLCRGPGSLFALSTWGAAPPGDGAADLGKPLLLPGRARLVSCGQAAMSSLRNGIGQAEAVASACPAPAVMTDLGRRLLLCLSGAMAGATPIDGNPPRAAGRRAAVERARAYIRKHLTEPIRLLDLCKHSYVQQRSLEYGFREVVGLSPMAYVKVLRLAAVRRRLLLGPLRSSSISQVALDSGFHHLGQFASDYKRFFLESPSITLKRGQLRYGCEPQRGPNRHNGWEARPLPEALTDAAQSGASVALVPQGERDSCIGAQTDAEAPSCE